ncbi:MAG: hypothetical protein KDK70_43370, partial [Myxococcales bacterium]|nr:hypothetical protein [Myxococcales bacterium]
GGFGEERLGGASSFEAVLEHGEEGLAAAGGEHVGGDDAGAQGGVVAHVEAVGQGGQADEPDGQQVAGVEGVVEEAGQVDEEVVAQVLGLVDDGIRSASRVVTRARLRGTSVP